MRFQQVEYRQRMALPGGGFATFGAIAEVEEGETQDEALTRLQKWVETQLADREMEVRVGVEIQNQLEAKRIELMNVEQRLLQAERRWRLAEKFLIRHGIEVPDNDSPFDRPPPYVQ